MTSLASTYDINLYNVDSISRNRVNKYDFRNMQLNYARSNAIYNKVKLIKNGMQINYNFMLATKKRNECGINKFCLITCGQKLRYNCMRSPCCCCRRLAFKRPYFVI